MGEQDLSDLLARVEKAEGPDRELDAAIWAELGSGKLTAEMAISGEPVPPGHRILGLTLREYIAVGAKDGAITWRVARFTASVDAALALVERMLPGWEWEASFLDGRYVFSLGDHLLGCDGEAATLPLAILAALLRALIAQQALPQPNPEGK